jgi:hypothetical protein
MKARIIRCLPGIVGICVLASCGGESPGSDLFGGGADKQAASIRIERMDHHQESSPRGLVSHTVKTEGDSTVVDFTCLEARGIYEVLLNVHYDAEIISFADIELHNCLGNPDELFQLVHADDPGLVAIGQVRRGLHTVDLQAGAPYARLRFHNRPSRQVAEVSEAAGMKLRDENVEFHNADVPMHFEMDGDNLIVTWEEANDGDYDGNMGSLQTTMVVRS